MVILKTVCVVLFTEKQEIGVRLSISSKKFLFQRKRSCSLPFFIPGEKFAGKRYGEYRNNWKDILFSRIEGAILGAERDNILD
jgi:hypothetical protein